MTSYQPTYVVMTSWHPAYITMTSWQPIYVTSMFHVTFSIYQNVRFVLRYSTCTYAICVHFLKIYRKQLITMITRHMLLNIMSMLHNTYYFTMKTEYLNMGNKPEVFPIPTILTINHFFFFQRAVDNWTLFLCWISPAVSRPITINI